MAIVCSQKLAQNIEGNATSFTSSAFLPVANNGYLLCVFAENGTAVSADPTITDNGTGLAWVKVASTLGDASRHPASLWRAMKPSGLSSNTITVDFGAQSIRNCVILIIEVTGMDTGGSDGANMIVSGHFATNSGSTGTTASVTLAAFADTVNNACFFASSNSTVVDTSVKAGFTQISDIFTGSRVSGFAEYKIGQDTAPNSTWTANAVWVAMGAEIKLGSVTYTKTGGATSPATGGGADVITYKKAGGGVSPATGGGADVITYKKTGGATSPATGGGDLGVTRTKTGGAISPATGGGAKAVVRLFTKTGGAISDAAGGGIKAKTSVKTGGGIASPTGGGADVITYTKTGGAISPATGGGARAKTFIKSGGAISSATGGGVRVVIQLPPPGVLVAPAFAGYQVDIARTTYSSEKNVVLSYLLTPAGDIAAIRDDVINITIISTPIVETVVMKGTTHIEFE